MGYPAWYRNAYTSAEKKKVATQGAIGQNTDTQEYNIPSSPFPGKTLIGVEIQGHCVVTYTAAEAPIANRSIVDAAIGLVDLRQTSDNKGTLFHTSGMLIRLNEYLMQSEIVEDAAPTAQGAGDEEADWVIQVPFCGKGVCSFKMRTGLIASVYAGDVSDIQTTFTLYAIYANEADVKERIVARETDVAAITEGNITSNMNAIEGANLTAILINESDFNSPTGADVLNRMSYSDGQIAYDKDAVLVFAENDLALGDPVDLPRTLGSFVFTVPSRPYRRDGSVFIQPEYTAATAQNVCAIQAM